MTKIKTMKDWNEEHTQRVPFVPRGHVKAIFDDNGNTLDSLMAVQDEKLSELGSEVYGFNQLNNLHNGWLKTNSFEDITPAKNYCIIPIKGGDEIIIVSNEERTAAVSVLKSYSEPTPGTLADFATGWNGKQPISSLGPNSVYEFKAPSDAKFLYVQRIYNNDYNFWPSKIIINGVDIEKNVKENIDALGEKANDAARKIESNANNILNVNESLNDFKEQSKSILGESEKVNYNLGQGIVNQLGTLSMDPYAVSIKEKLDAKKWKVELKEGYILFRLVVFDGEGEYGSQIVNLSTSSYIYEGSYQTMFAIKRVDGADFTVSDEPINSLRYIYADGMETELEEIKDKIKLMGSPTSVTIPRLYPNAKIPVISMIFDDCSPNDEQIVDLLDQYNAKCSFAFMATDVNISSYVKKYLSWQKKGYGVCSHSIDSLSVLDTNDDVTNGLTEQEALYKFIESKERLEKEGISVNGWVSPNSTMSASFIPLLRRVYAYGFTRGTDADNVRDNENLCTIVRKSMQATSLQGLKDYIDSCIELDRIVTLYGHSQHFGQSYVTETGESEVWSLAKLESIVQYIIKKRNEGVVYFGNTDDCVKYYFDL